MIFKKPNIPEIKLMNPLNIANKENDKKVINHTKVPSIRELKSKIL